MMRKSMDVSSKLGDYMLKGYTLLNLHCPLCNCPLVQKKGEDLMTCVSCEREVITQKALEKREAQGEQLNVEIPEEAVKQRENAKAKGGEEEKGDKGIDDYDLNDHDDDAALDEFVQQPRLTAEEFARQRREDEVISDMIGAKMLMGWAMLGEHCKRCRTPLLRSRDGNISCVACNRSISAEEEEEENKMDGGDGEGKNNGGVGKERKLSGEESSVAARKEEGTCGNLVKDAYSIHTTTSSANMMKNTTALGDSKGRGPSPSSSSPSPASTTLKLATTQSKDLLTGKLKQLNVRLDKTDNMQELSAVARAISDVAKALSTIQELTATI
eukprot:jgi/Bigna1/141608/aug1.63_g16316